MKEIKSNFITQLYFSFQDDYYYYLAMEWAQEGDLFSLMKHGSKRRNIFKQVGE